MAEDHDKGYRLLFSYPKMVADLLRRFVGGEWLARLDFSTLEKVSERDLSPELVRREKDILWRLRYRGEGDGGWFYVYLHIEFQSRERRFMALNVLTYKVLLYEDLVRRDALTTSGLIPPVFSAVLYNGKAPWTGPVRAEELLEPVPGFEPGELPDGLALTSFRLIEQRAYPPAELDEAASPVATLFQLEQSAGIEDIRRGVVKLIEELQGPGHQSLREAFTVWVSTALVPARAKGARIPELGDLMELKTMLEQNVLEWRQDWFHEGERLGEAKILLRQIKTKFGSVPAAIKKRVQSANAKELLTWAERVLSAESLDQIFED